MALVQVRLARDSMQTPWGFRLQGGKDLNQPLTVQRVFANTPSERELHRGDVIVAINGRDTSNLSHKQAQDAISGGGGQIELLVQRPAGNVNIKPLTPVSDTHAPLFHAKPPQIQIPIQRGQGPSSPTRIIPISPQRPTPPKPPAKPVRNTEPNRDMASTGFMPKKVTLSKLGGGGPDFGSAYGAAAHSPPARSQGYRPVAAPVPPQPARDQYDYGGYQPQQASPPVHQPTQNQFSAPQVHSPQPPAAVQRTHKPLPTFGRARAHEEAVTFGVDYTKPQPKPQPKHQPSNRPRPPPVNRRDEDELDSQPWSNTLRSESKLLKPWEREALEAQKYQQGTVDQPYRPHMQPPTAPKPKIVQITASSTARPPEQHPPQQSSPTSGYSVPAQPQKPLAPGERNWNDSYVYKMVHSSEKTTHSTRQDVPGQPARGETVTTTRETHETKYPGQEPQRRVTETVQRSGAPDFKFDHTIGISDF